MSSLVEFHVASLWGLKPFGVREIITCLKESRFEKSEFLFDQRRNWFQITSQEEDELKIRQQLKEYLNEFEEEVLDEDEDVTDDEGALVKRLDTVWMGSWDDEARLEAIDFTEFRFPDAFDDLPHRHVWDVLNNIRLNDILTNDQFQELNKSHNVTLGHNRSLTEVYIGAEAKDELDNVKTKLDSLHKIKELRDSPPTHLLWTEAYKEKDGFEMTVDTRFLANTDPALIAATFLDLAFSTDPAVDYEMLAEAIVLRLCRFDEARGFHTSLVGPRLAARRGTAAKKVGKRRYRVPNRSGARRNLYGVDIGPKDSTWISPEKGAVAELRDSPYGASEVENWLNALEEAYAVPKPSSAIDPSAIPIKALGSAAKVPSAAARNLINLDEPNATVIMGAASMNGTGRLPAQAPNSLDMDDVFVEPVTLTMRPLVPQLGTVSATSVAESGAKDTAGPLVDMDFNAEQSGQADVYRASPKRNLSKDSAATHQSTAGKAKPRPDRAAAQVPAWFILELNQAVRDLVCTGPYLRGKLSIRADLGRILITGMDYTALAFNPPGSASNGWKKAQILRILNQGSRTAQGHGLTFTRMLTQEGEEVEHMLGALDIATAKPMWKSQPTESVVYSFYCVSKGHAFFMDLEVDEDASKFNYSLRTKQDDKAPIWIHCSLRSWDVRIMMSHADSHALEAKYGEFAKSFVNSFAITVPQDNKLHIRIGVHKGFGVSVESMRIHTTFRFLSEDEKSYLDLTEVEETVFKACSPLPETASSNKGPSSPDEWMFYTVDPKRLTADVRASEERGQPTFWYEASVRSVAAEREFAVNKTMGLGEKAPWNFGRFAELGVVASLCKPALRMAQTMDSVGGYNDNRQASKLVLPQMNDEEVVPGAIYETRRDSSTSSSASRPHVPLSNPATLVQASGPPGTALSRAPRQGYLTPPSTVTSPVPLSARTAAAADPQKQAEGSATPGNVINPYGPMAAGGGGGFGVHGPRAPSHNRQPGNRQPSSTGSDISRAPAASYRPPNQFW